MQLILVIDDALIAALDDEAKARGHANATALMQFIVVDTATRINVRRQSEPIVDRVAALALDVRSTSRQLIDQKAQVTALQSDIAALQVVKATP